MRLVLAALLVAYLGVVSGASSDRGHFLVRLEGTSTFLGYGMMRFDNVTNTLTWTVYHQVGQTTSPVPAVSAAIRRHAGLGVIGPLIHPFTDAVSPMRGSLQMTNPTDINDLIMGYLYLGISTSQKEDYLRGNLTWNGYNGPAGSTIQYEYAVELDNAQVVQSTAPTSGQGGIAILYTTSNNVYVNLVHNIVGCTQITLRRGRVGVANLTHAMAEVCNGAACDHTTLGAAPKSTVYSFIDTNPFPGPNQPTRLSSFLDQNVIYMVAHTTGSPDGEARGQVNVPLHLSFPGGRPLDAKASCVSASALVLVITLLLGAFAWI
jgi:hypothetical protein